MNSITSTGLQAVKQRLGIVGSSPALLDAIDRALRVAPIDLSVLIIGESGTGKEFFPKIIHSAGARKHARYIAVNCGAIPEGTIDSELFGHEKGSFTSAIKQKKGKFELAHNGTLFLDEIGDMSLDAQAKVLRALQENKISRIGSDTDIQVDVRVIAATNKNLKEEIAAGRFREDLYHRLSVIIINVPPLKERTEDIEDLILYFTQEICTEMRITPKQFTPEAIERMKNYEWSGNIRELRNVLERLIILCNNVILPEDVELYK